MKKIPFLLTQDEISATLLLFNDNKVDLTTWKKLTNDQYSHNSLLSFQNDWKVFVEYCNNDNILSLPSKVSIVRQFIEIQSKKRKISTIKRYIATLSLVHRIHALQDPTRHREVRFALNRLYVQKAGDAIQATPFHLSHLNILHKKLINSSKLKDIRDLLICTLTLEGMLKRCDLVKLTYQSIEKINEGYILHLEYELVTLSIQACTVLKRWIDETKITDGPLLRRINKHQQLGTEPMDHSSVYRVFRHAAEILNLENNLTFSGQSPRVGASQDLSNAGKSIKEIQHQGRWKSPAMPAQYVGNQQASLEAFNKLKRKVEKD